MSKTHDKLDNLARQGVDTYVKVSRIERRIAELAKHVDSITNYLIDEKVEALHVQGITDVLAHAVDTKQVIAFRYERTDGVELLRIVSPWEITQTATGPHLVGWDHIRREIRQFAVPRTAEAEIEPGYGFVAPNEAEAHAPFSGSLVRGDELVR